jgi:hypothetical protein
VSDSNGAMIAMVIESYLEGQLQLDVATQPNNTSLILKASFHFRRRMRKLNYFQLGKREEKGGGALLIRGKN